MPPRPSIEEEITRAVAASAGSTFSMRVEAVNGTVSLCIGWIKGLDYQHFEVVISESGIPQPDALRTALNEVK